MKKRKRSRKGNSEFGESCKPGSSRLELTFVPGSSLIRKEVTGYSSYNTIADFRGKVMSDL